MNLDRMKLAFLLFIIECLVILFFIQFVTYENEDNRQLYFNLSTSLKAKSSQKEQVLSAKDSYISAFTGLNGVLIFLGFGFLYSSLKRFGYSALGVTMLVGGTALQWSIICRGIFHRSDYGTITLDIPAMISANCATVSALVGIGAVLGVTTPLHLIVICLVEVFMYTCNEYVVVDGLMALDVGGSMTIHIFGSFFSLSVSRFFCPANEIRFNTKKEARSTNTTDVFTMIGWACGTLFLWIYWPNFNGILATGGVNQDKAVLNTIWALTGSLMFTFIVSILVNPQKKLSTVYIQHATLAGGIAIGSCVDLLVQPSGAIMIGALGGTMSTLSLAYVTPLIGKGLNLHDTTRIFSLHTIPGIVGGIAGVLMAGIASEVEYGETLYIQYPARSPERGSIKFNDLLNHNPHLQPGEGRTAYVQAAYQLGAIGVSIAIAILSGALTGFALKLPVFGKVPQRLDYDDIFMWDLEDTSKYPLMGISIRNIGEQEENNNCDPVLEAKSGITL